MWYFIMCYNALSMLSPHKHFDKLYVDFQIPNTAVLPQIQQTCVQNAENCRKIFRIWRITYALDYLYKAFESPVSFSVRNRLLEFDIIGRFLVLQDPMFKLGG